MRPFYDFISPIRVFRMLRAKFHKHKHSTSIPQQTLSGTPQQVSDTTQQAVSDKNDNRKLTIRSFFVKSPLKMDFNQLRSHQLIRMMQHIQSRMVNEQKKDVSVILIGHSKTFIPYNETTLRPFLQWLEKHI